MTTTRSHPPDLGRVPDAVIAKRCGVSRQAVHQWRTLRGIAPCVRAPVPADGISELILRAREALGHTQVQAAEAARMSHRTFQRIEQGDLRSRTRGNLLMINEYLRSARIPIVELDKRHAGV